MKSLIKECKQLFVSFLSVIMVLMSVSGDGVLLAFADSGLPHIENEVILNFESYDNPIKGDYSRVVLPEYMILSVENRSFKGTAYDINNISNAVITIDGTDYDVDYRFVENFNVLFIAPEKALHWYCVDKDLEDESVDLEWSGLSSLSKYTEDNYNWVLDTMKGIKSITLSLSYDDGSVIQEPISMRFGIDRFGVSGRKYFATANAFVTTLPDSKNLDNSAFYELENAIRFLDDSSLVANRYYVDIDSKDNVVLPLDKFSDDMLLSEVLVGARPVYRTASAIDYGDYEKENVSYTWDSIETNDFPEGITEIDLVSGTSYPRYTDYSGQWVRDGYNWLYEGDVEAYWDLISYSKESDSYSLLNIEKSYSTVSPRSIGTEVGDLYSYLISDETGNKTKGYMGEDLLQVYEILNFQEVPFVFLDNKVEPKITTVQELVNTTGGIEVHSYDTDVNEEFEGVDGFNPREVETYFWGEAARNDELREMLTYDDVPRNYFPAVYLNTRLFGVYRDSFDLNKEKLLNMASSILEYGIMPNKIANVSFSKACSDNNLPYLLSEGDISEKDVPQETQGRFHLEFKDGVNIAGALANKYIGIMKGDYYLNSYDKSLSASRTYGQLLYELGLPDRWNKIDSNDIGYRDFVAYGNYVDGDTYKDNYEYHDLYDFINHCTECRVLDWKAFDYKTLYSLLDDDIIPSDSIILDKSYSPDYANLERYKSNTSFKDYFELSKEAVVGDTIIAPEKYYNLEADKKYSLGRLGTELGKEASLEETSDIPNSESKFLDNKVQFDVSLLQGIEKGYPLDVRVQLLLPSERIFNGGDSLVVSNFYGSAYFTNLFTNAEYRWGEIVLASKPDAATSIKYDNETGELSWQTPVDEGLGTNEMGNTRRDGFVYLTNHIVRVYNSKNDVIYERSIPADGAYNQKCLIPSGLIDEKKDSYRLEVCEANTIGISEAAGISLDKLYEPNINVVKVADKDNYSLGDEIIFTDTVTNTGNWDLSDVTLKEDLDGVFVGDNLNDFIVDSTNHKIIIGDLAIGESVVINYSVAADDSNIVNSKVSSNVKVYAKEGVKDEFELSVDIIESDSDTDTPDSDTEVVSDVEIDSDSSSDSDDDTEKIPDSDVNDTESDIIPNEDTDSDSNIGDTDSINSDTDSNNLVDSDSDTDDVVDTESDVVTSDTEDSSDTDEQGSDVPSDIDESDSEVLIDTDTDTAIEVDSDKVVDSDSDGETDTDVIIDSNTDSEVEITDSDIIIPNAEISVSKKPEKPIFDFNDAVVVVDIIKNTGDCVLTDIVVTENLPGVFDGTDTNVYNIPELNPGEKVELRFIVNISDVDGNPIVSTVNVKTKQGAEDEASCEVKVEKPNVGVTLSKKPDKEEYIVGDKIVFTDVVKNTSEITIHNVVLVEDLPGVFNGEDSSSITIGSLKPGEEVTIEFIVDTLKLGIDKYSYVQSNLTVSSDEGASGSVSAFVVIDVKKGDKEISTPDEPVPEKNNPTPQKQDTPDKGSNTDLGNVPKSPVTGYSYSDYMGAVSTSSGVFQIVLVLLGLAIWSLIVSSVVLVKIRKD